MRCRACNAETPVSFDDDGLLDDTLCNECETKTLKALAMTQIEFEGFWYDDWCIIGGCPDFP